MKTQDSLEDTWREAAATRGARSLRCSFASSHVLATMESVGVIILICKDGHGVNKD